MGVITGVGGGIIRDVLQRADPHDLRTEIYAPACIIGAGLFTLPRLYVFSTAGKRASMMGMVWSRCSFGWRPFAGI